MAQVTPSTTARAGQPSLWRYRARRSVRRWDLTPLQLTVVYLAFGFAALYVSDVLLVRLIEDPATLSQLQAAKGGLEIVVTGGLLFVLARRSRRSLRRQNDRLERTQEELQVLHRVLRHNLRNDVNVVEGFGRQLEPAVEDPTCREWCEEILEATERIAGYTEQARKINQVTGEGQATTLEVAALAADVVERQRAESGGATIQLSASQACPVTAHPMLDEALTELVSNAIEHAEQSDPQVEVSVDPDAGPPHETAVTVADDGPGIPQSVREAVLGAGETPLEHLDGLGLWFVSWVVRVSDGRLEIEDRQPHGTRVTVRLPKAARDATSAPVTEGLLGAAR